MLHKSKSNILNTWKYALILPALVIFMMSFNTKDVFIEKSTSPIHDFIEEIDKHSTQASTISKDLNITKDMTDAELENIKTILKEKGFNAIFKNIKRNNKGEITSIKVEIKSKNSNANYGVSGDKPIQPITININSDDNSIGISSVSAKADKQVVYIQSNEDEVEEKDDTSVKKSVYLNGKATAADTIVIEKDVRKMVFRDPHGNKIDIIATENGKKSVRAYTIDNETPLFILNGKAITRSEMESINPRSIDNVTVLKDKNAIEKYGEKGLHGVVEIITTPIDENVIIEVLNVNYKDDKDASKNASLAYITKSATDNSLEANKTNLRLFDVDVSYSKVKRNKSGEITHIKITIEDLDGRLSSATFENPDGIPNIRYGIKSGKLVVQSY